MAKFCNYCGTQLSDDAAFCPNCGSNVASAAPQASAPAESTPAQTVDSSSYSSSSTASAVAPKEGGNNKNLIIGVCAAVAAVVVIFFIISSIVSGFGYKGPIKKYFTAINKEDGKKYMKAIPKFVSDAADKDAGDYEDYLKDLKDLMDVGKDPKISYDIIDKIEKTDDELENYEKSINKKYKKQLDDDVEVSAGYEVLLKLTVKGSKRSKKDFTSVTVLKIDGDWYFMD